MGITKSNLFSPSQIELASIAKALGHPARIAILDYLLTQKTCICNDIVQKIALAQPTISQHLKELKQAGIIQGSIEGNSICYCINPASIETIKNYIHQFPTSTFCCT